MLGAGSRVLDTGLHKDSSLLHLNAPTQEPLGPLPGRKLVNSDAPTYSESWTGQHGTKYYLAFIDEREQPYRTLWPSEYPTSEAAGHSTPPQ